MTKVFLIHGFEGAPNGGWRPWLMSELDKKDVYACALAMPNPDRPVCAEWVAEIARHVNEGDEVYLVGHSLGSTAILRYLESAPPSVRGAVLVSGPSSTTGTAAVDAFLQKPFDFDKIRTGRCFAVIHGDDDPLVPLDDAHFLSEKLGAELIVVKGGKHLNGSAGFHELPQCLATLEKLMS